jgi:DNA-directed RNA polymerase subunit RPC12/RpoP
MSEAKAGVVVTCGSCGSRLRLRGEAQGRTGKCPKCGVRVQFQLPPDPTPAAAPVTAPTPSAETAPTTTQSVIEKTPAPGTFLFFPATAREPQVRTAPRTPAEIAAPAVPAATISATTSAHQPVAVIAIVAFAALVIGAAALFATRQFGGLEYFVVKRSAVAWMVGMLSAAALMRVSTERTSPLRLTAALTAAGAVLVASLFAWPAPFGPIDLLQLALAIAGSGTSFILAETTPAAKREPSTSPSFSH